MADKNIYGNKDPFTSFAHRHTATECIEESVFRWFPELHSALIRQWSLGRDLVPAVMVDLTGGKSEYWSEGIHRREDGKSTKTMSFIISSTLSQWSAVGPVRGGGTMGKKYSL